MARFTYEEQDKYGSQGSAGFFGLKNDKDTAIVRFMYETLSEIEGYAVHEVEIDGKKRYVNCLRNYSDPVDACPFCAAGLKVLAKLFIQVLDVESGEVKTWDRGKSFYARLSSLCARHNPLCGTVFEIERNGKPKDTNTTYEIYENSKDGLRLSELPEVSDLMGTLVLDKSFEEMEAFLNDGVFPSDGGAPAPAPRGGNPPATSRRPEASTTGVRRGSIGSTNTTPPAGRTGSGRPRF